MSLRYEPIGPVPEGTARVARAAFPRGTTWMRLRDELGVLYEDANFRPLFAIRGRPAEAPWRLALVSVMQFAAQLSDRQAAEAVRARIDWKYLLGLELADPVSMRQCCRSFALGSSKAGWSSACSMPCSRFAVPAAG
jgi:transposase